MAIGELLRPALVVGMSSLAGAPLSRRNAGVARQFVREQLAAGGGALELRTALHEYRDGGKDGVGSIEIRSMHSEHIIAETHDDGPVPGELAAVAFVEAEADQMPPKFIGIAWPRMKLQRKLFGPAAETEETP